MGGLGTCPSCQYRLVEDKELPVRMITAMDGNDSLKRVERKEEDHPQDVVTPANTDGEEDISTSRD